MGVQPAGTGMRLTERPNMPESVANALADLPAVLTFREAADALRVDPRTITRWCGQGRLKKLKLSPGQTGAARVLKSDLLRLLGGGTQ